MQAFLSGRKYATVSTVETVKAVLFPHSEATLAPDEPIRSTGLSCRISSSRPGTNYHFFAFSSNSSMYLSKSDINNLS